MTSTPDEPEITTRQRLKHHARQANRLRWLRKWRNVARREGNATVGQALTYVLTDPELDTYSYELANEVELAVLLQPIVRLNTEAILALFSEARTDQVLAARIRRGSRWDLSVKRNPPIGRHLVTYAIVRATRPPTVLEIGVRFGLGSLVILRALERNAREGYPAGELVSVDIDPFAGSLVSQDAAGWDFVAGPSPDALATAVRAEHRVGLIIADSVQDPAVTTAEVRVALAQPAQPLIVMQSGWNMVVPDLCDAADVPWVRLVEQPQAHIGAGRQAFLARFDDAESRSRALEAATRSPHGMRDADGRFIG